MSAHRGLKNDYTEIKKWWFEVVRLFVHMYCCFENFVLLYGECDFVYNSVLRIIDGRDVNLVIGVLWVIHLYYFVIRHLCSILLILLYYILLFVRLKVFYLLKWKKILQLIYVLSLLVDYFVCVLRMCYRFLSIKKNEIQ